MIGEPLIPLADEELRKMQEHYVWFSQDNQKNREVASALQRIIKNGGKVIQLREGRLLEGHVLLPFLETPEGNRYFGVDSINRYAERYV